jgi:hypothetical protein
MYCGDIRQQTGSSTKAGNMSMPLALKTLEHSELYARRKKSSGSSGALHRIDDLLCDYDTLDSGSLCESSDSLVLPPALSLQKNNSVSTTQSR